MTADRNWDEEQEDWELSDEDVPFGDLEDERSHGGRGGDGPRPRPTSPDVASLGYGKAVAELEKILDKLEQADPDVDELTALVQRGAELLRFCRSRLEAAEAQVSAVVRDLRDEPATARSLPVEPAPGPDPEPDPDDPYDDGEPF